MLDRTHDCLFSELAIWILTFCALNSFEKTLVLNTFMHFLQFPSIERVEIIKLFLRENKHNAKTTYITHAISIVNIDLPRFLCMMMSWHGNTFCLSDLFLHWLIPLKKDQQHGTFRFSLISAWKNCWTNSWVTGDLRQNDGHVCHCKLGSVSCLVGTTTKKR